MIDRITKEELIKHLSTSQKITLSDLEVLSRFIRQHTHNEITYHYSKALHNVILKQLGILLT